MVRFVARSLGCWVALTAAAAFASEDAAGAPGDLVTAHLQTRQQALARQREAAVTLARQQGWMAYRLSQKRTSSFIAHSDTRPEQARATALALSVLARTLDEARKIEAERQEVERDRVRLARRAASSGSAPVSAEPVATPTLVWPTKGPIISAPGLRQDAVTGVVVRDPGVQILARLDAPVACPAEGVVQRIDQLPGGGHAVVLALGEGWVAVLSGLRAVEVGEGDAVRAGATLGRVGRTLDGAPVVRLALWQGGRPVDPRPATPAPGRAARMRPRR